MQIVQNKKKSTYKIPLNLEDVLEHHLVELPTHIFLEICENKVFNHENKQVGDGEIFILNFIEEGITLSGKIKGYKEEGIQTTDFLLKPKENCSMFGWKYSDVNQIELEIDAILHTGQEIKLVEKETIPLPTRSKLLLFYS